MSLHLTSDGWAKEYEAVVRERDELRRQAASLEGDLHDVIESRDSLDAAWKQADFERAQLTSERDELRALLVEEQEARHAAANRAIEAERRYAWLNDKDADGEILRLAADLGEARARAERLKAENEHNLLCAQEAYAASLRDRAELVKLRNASSSHGWQAFGRARAEADELHAYAVRLYRAALAFTDCIVIEEPVDHFPGGRALLAALDAVPESVKRAATREDDPLHPNGRCTCFGEGRCDWCVRTNTVLDDEKGGEE